MNIYVINRKVELETAEPASNTMIVAAQTAGGAWRLAKTLGFVNDLNHTIDCICKIPLKTEGVLWWSNKN